MRHIAPPTAGDAHLRQEVRPLFQQKNTSIRSSFGAGDRRKKASGATADYNYPAITHPDQRYPKRADSFKGRKAALSKRAMRRFSSLLEAFPVQGRRPISSMFWQSGQRAPRPLAVFLPEVGIITRTRDVHYASMTDARISPPH
jgi:hypothetical protein